MARILLSSGLVLSLGLFQFSWAQEPSDKPDAPTAKTNPMIPALPHKISVTPEPKSVAEPEPVAVKDLPALAASLAEYISVTGCQAKACTVLVTDFTLLNGDTSEYGMELADKLSGELAKEGRKIQVVDRRRLQNFLAQDRIPEQSINDGVIRAIANALDARFIVFGTSEKLDSRFVRMSTEMIDTTSKNWEEYNLVVTLSPTQSNGSFVPVEPFPTLPAITSTTAGDALRKAKVDGTGLPYCTYMPGPSYSEEARKLGINGSVMAEAVVTVQGKLEHIRIVHGLPSGMNENTIEALQTWRCEPALQNGKPVPTLVKFTISFRMY
jgi:TonB family protein